MRGLKKLLIVVTSVIVVSVFSILIAGLRDHIINADLIVVPGNTIAPDGTPSPRLRARLDVALRLFREGRAPLIYVSGGIGKEAFDEAVSMSDYLVKNGVHPKSIVQDSFGIDTTTTAKNVASYMRTNKLKSALVATQYFHIPRMKMALERQGVYVAGTVHAQYFEIRDLYSTLRETLAIVAYCFR